MILAAGRGERMRPLTDRTPKPLLNVRGRRLIEHHLVAMSGAGIVQVIINLSWLGARIREAIGAGCRYGVNVRYSDEGPEALETAGGVVAALPWLGPGPFLVANADVYCDIDYGHLPGPAPDDLGVVVLVSNPTHNAGGDFALAGDRVANGGPRPYTFSGIGIYRGELFAGLAPGRRPLAPLLRAAADAGRLRGVVHTGAWSDVGTPERLAELNKKKRPRPKA